MPPAVIAVAALATAAVSTGVSIYSSQKAAQYQKEANQIQMQQADLQNARSKRDAIRQSRIAYANSQSAAENQGSALSSSSQGGLGSIVSQVNDNLSFLDQYGFMSDQASKALGKANQWKANANTFGDIGGFALGVAGHSPQISESAKKVFGSGG